jgi:oxaloacetate decarboxylase beta subunit
MPRAFSTFCGQPESVTVSRIPMMTAQKDGPSNLLVMHAMAPHVAGAIGSAVAAGVLLALLGG